MYINTNQWICIESISKSVSKASAKNCVHQIMNNLDIKEHESLPFDDKKYLFMNLLYFVIRFICIARLSKANHA